MRFRSTFRLTLAGAVFAALSLAVALALPAALAQRPDGSHAATNGDSVNRAGKADRLRVIVRPPEAAPPDVKLPNGGNLQLLEGCEPIHGRMVHSPAAKLAQSCVT
jgi:hypothetical protein